MSHLIASFIVLPGFVIAVVMAIKTYRINKDTERIMQDTRRINLDTAERWERMAELCTLRGDVYGARSAMDLSRRYRALAEGRV